MKTKLLKKIRKNLIVVYSDGLWYVIKKSEPYYCLVPFKGYSVAEMCVGLVMGFRYVNHIKHMKNIMNVFSDIRTYTDKVIHSHER